VWALSTIPLLSALLVVWAWWLPPGEGRDYVQLVGTWQAKSVSAGEVAPPLEGPWGPVAVPGLFVGMEGQPLWLRREVSLPEALRGTDLRLVLGYVRDAVVRVFVNGHAVGTRGVYETGFIGSDSEVTPVLVPREVVGTGPVTVVLEVRPSPAEQSGLADGRLLFGREDVLLPWSFHQTSVRSALELGALGAMSFLIGLVLVLWWLQRGRVNRDLYVGTLGLTFATLLYLLATTGFVVTSFLSPAAGVKLMDVAVMVLGVFIPEFIEAYYLGRVTVLRRVNRVVSGLSLFACLGLAVVSDAGPEMLYEGYTNWLFVLMAWSLFLAVRDVVRRPSRFGPLLLTAIFFAVVAGLNDLLGDLNLLFTPRLFTLGITNLGTCAAIVVVGEFLQMVEENRRLSRELGEQNAQLEVALERAEESDRARSAFLANTSHELRTPLNSIINIPAGLLEHLEETLQVRCEGCGAVFVLDPGVKWSAQLRCPECGAATQVSETTRRLTLEGAQVERLLTTVSANGQHLLSVVNDLLDFSKLDAGRMTLRREPTEVAALLGALEGAVALDATRAGVTLQVEPAPAVTLDVDPHKLGQALLNLTLNAVKFSDGRGVVTVAARVVGDALELEVRDQGIGIAPEHHEVIFEGFRQVEAGRTRRFGGTGLGLAIARRLVVLHGGTLTVQSALGQGSTFTVRLPLTREAA
jgi:signal transduction histidine kinase